MKLRIGLIEIGSAWQNRHRPALRMLHDRFTVRAVYCGVAKKAEAVAAEFQADVVDGYRAMVNRSDIDAVMILERSWHGWLPVLAACEAGKAVYWAGDPQFDPIADAAIRKQVDESGIAFMAELPRRFAPGIDRDEVGPASVDFLSPPIVGDAFETRRRLRFGSFGRKPSRVDRVD